MKVPREEREFAELVVSRLGQTVSELRTEADIKLLSDEQTRKVLLLAFKIVGEKASLSYASLVQKIRHSKNGRSPKN